MRPGVEPIKDGYKARSTPAVTIERKHPRPLASQGNRAKLDVDLKVCDESSLALWLPGRAKFDRVFTRLSMPL
jgi:hypothetical protein